MRHTDADSLFRLLAIHRLGSGLLSQDPGSADF
jgi:hypothetical protein